MAYERLTVKDIRTGKCERIGDPTASAVYYINDRFGRLSLDEEVITKRISFKEVYNRLAELEDMIESGLLKEFPYKLGTPYWTIENKVGGGKIVINHILCGYKFDRNDMYVLDDDVDGSPVETHIDDVFLTEEAANEALKEAI